MKAEGRIFVNTAISVIVALVAVFFMSSDALERAKLVALDTLFRCRPPAAAKAPIVIIEIDDYNISKVGRWPWERTWHASIAKILKDLGAKDIYYDIIFSEKATGKEDEVFRQGVAYAKNVFLPYAFTTRDMEADNVLLPLEMFRKEIRGSGFINIYPDMDGCLRRVPLFFYNNGKPYYHLAVELAKSYLKIAKVYHEKNELILSGPQDNIIIPMTEGNRMMVNWLGKWQETFKHYSFLDIVNGYQNATNIDLLPIRGSICIVAVTALGLYDIKPTPLQSECPAVGVLATAVDNIINNRFIHVAPGAITYILIFLMAMLPMWCLSENAFRQAIPFIVAPLIFLISLLIFAIWNTWVDYSLPLIVLVVSYLINNAYHLTATILEKRRLYKLAVTDGLTGLFNVSHFKARLTDICAAADKNGSENFAIVMADIDHFKSFNDSYGHLTGDLVLKEVAATLKSCLRPEDIIARYGGEEIIIYLQGSSLKTAFNVSERMRRQVEAKEIKNEKGSYKVTISMGVASFRQGDSEISIIARADEGLYKAKATGRNKIETAEAT